MACKTCSEKYKVAQVELALQNKTDGDWLYQNDVLPLCKDCYDSMLRNNVTKIRKEAFLKKLRSQAMKIYEVVYVGDEGTSFNFGGHMLERLSPKYFEKDELPITLSEIAKLGILKITALDIEKKPTEEEITGISAKLKGIRSVTWMGASPKRVNEYGVFIKNVPNYNVSDAGIEVLSKNASYKVI